MPTEADFAVAEVLVFALALVCGFEAVFAADFAGVEALAPALGFAGFGTVFEAGGVFTGVTGFLAVVGLCGTEPPLLGVEAAFAGTVAFAGTAVLAGTTVLVGTETFAATSVLTVFATSFGAGGFAGFFFGGSCNSAKRSMTSSIDCSESAWSANRGTNLGSVARQRRR